MTSFAASNDEVSTLGAGTGYALASPRTNRSDAAQVLALVLGTLGILFGLAIAVGTPLAGLR